MLRRVLLIALVSCLQMACSSTPPAPSPGSPVSAAGAASSTPSAAPASPAATAPVAAGGAARPAHLDPNSVLSREHSIYFQFDDAVVDGKYGALIDRHARYLLAHPDLKVTLQGNTDERGGTEYNLSLGQRRAQAVKSALHLLGVPDDQAEPVSFGEERPMADGHDDAAWAQNRRVDIVYMR